MPRFSVTHNGKWACFSTIVDAFITEFMSKEEYEKWRRDEYGMASHKPAEQCNMYTMAEAVESASLYYSKEDVLKNLVESGIGEAEAGELYAKHKIEKDEGAAET